MPDDLTLAFNTLKAKRHPYSQLYRYYDGTHPLMYTARRLKELFAGIDTVFTQNWCAVVIDVMKERINLQHLQVTDNESAQDALDKFWSSQQLQLESDDIVEGMLVTGEAYLIIWPEEEEEVQAFANDPRLVHVFYEPGNPRKKTFAAKWWVDDSEKSTRMVLYYPDKLEYYKAGSTSPSSANAFSKMEDDAENSYGEIPVFHYRSRRRSCMGELHNVIPIQNGINKLLADMMVAAEFGAFRQRWVISNTDVNGKLKNAPNEIWWVPAGDGIGQSTTIGEFAATDLSTFFKAVEENVKAIAAITSTPEHYFFPSGTPPSGEALITLETALNKKVKNRIARMSPVWVEAAAFILKLLGIENVNPQTIVPLYSSPEIVQPKTQAEVTELRVRSKVPLSTALRKEGWSDGELEQMHQDEIDDRQRQQATLASALLESERQFNAGK